MTNRFVPQANGDPVFGVGVTAATGPGFVSSVNGKATRQGTASAYSILGLVAFGNAANSKAAQNGSIDTIHSSQMDVFKLHILWLPIYTRYTTIVSGI